MSISPESFTPVSPAYEAQRFWTVWLSMEAIAVTGFIALIFSVWFTRRSAFTWASGWTFVVLSVLSFIGSYCGPQALWERANGFVALVEKLNDSFVGCGGMALLFSVAIVVVNFAIPAAKWLRSLRPFDYARVLALVLIVMPIFYQGQYQDSENLLPSGYFILLRWIVCPVLALTAYRSYKMRGFAWTWIYGVDAAIFNPVFISDLGKVWPFVDCVTVVLIIASFFLAFRHSESALQS